MLQLYYSSGLLFIYPVLVPKIADVIILHSHKVFHKVLKVINPHLNQKHILTTYNNQKYLCAYY